jgi:HSP20 family protein
MSTLDQLRDGLSRAWESLAEGWTHLRDRASYALTRFNPVRRGNALETADEQLVFNAARWGLLPAEVSESVDEVIVRLEMPGMEREDFDISVAGDVLVVRGEKRLKREQRDARYTVLECAYGSFERAIPLPAPADEARAKASYRNGVLCVTLPKIAAVRARRIPISTA